MVEYVNGSSTPAQFFSLKICNRFEGNGGMPRNKKYHQDDGIFFTQKIEHVQNSDLHKRQCELLASLPQGGYKKLELNVRFF